jgi:hypothetical protein
MTIESLVGTARASFYSVKSELYAGDQVTHYVDVEPVWDGYTDVDWNSSTTTGVQCDCGWSYRGEDWSTQLNEARP